MKYTIFVALLFPLASFSQSSSLTDLAGFSEADSNRAHMSVSGKAFELMSKIEADSIMDEQVKKLAASIKGMDGYMGFTPVTAQNMIASIEKKSNFEQYAEFSRKTDFLRFYIDEKDGIVKEMIMIAYDKYQGFAGSVYGSMDIRDVGELSKLISMKGFEYLNGDEKK